jgi:two-component system chemotaxis sensor kinase CheA
MNDSIVLEQKDFWNMLLDDWKQCRDGLDELMLKLEVNGEDRALADDLFGRIHRVKRGASFTGLTAITMITHEIETALQMFPEREPEVRSEIIDCLLAAADILNDCIERLNDRLQDPGAGEGDVLTIEWDVDDRWNEVAQQLRDILAARSGHPSGGEEGAEEPFSDPPGKTKEEFLFEIYELLDRMNGLFPGLEQDEHNIGALNELLLTVRGMKDGIEIFSAVLQPDGELSRTLGELALAVQRFETLLALIVNKKHAFSKEWLRLSQALAEYMKDALESAAMDQAAIPLSEDLSDRLDKALAALASAEDQADSGQPHPADDPDRSTAPASDARQAQEQKTALPQSIRVSQEKLDKMMNMISELLIAKNGFMHLSAKLNTEYDLPELSKEMKEVGLSLNRISEELQNAVMSVRMVEVKTVFQKMPRIVRDVAQMTGKKIELTMTGENTEIDKTIIEQISDPIVHLIRNAADHGIEHADERVRKGKSETGRIILRAYNKDKNVYIEIEDDGKGIDTSMLKRKAVERGFITPEQADRMTKSQLTNLIFLPGFSTAGQITGVSGRGVGMDIVKKNIEKIKGGVTIHSEVDKGTKIVIHLPLTIAISRGLVVDVADESYIVPIDHISETVKINARDIHEYDGKYFASYKGEAIGIEWMSRLFLLGDLDRGNAEEHHAVIVSDGAEKFGLIVDRLRNEQEFVIKPLHGQLARIPGISGSTLLGDGRVVLIVNPIELIQLAKK